MRILVTGGSGFIGTNLIEALGQDQDNHVRSLDIKPPANLNHAGLWEECDVRDGRSVERAVRSFSPDVIFHLAARTDLHGRTVDDYEANTLGVQNIVDAANDLEHVRVI